MKGPFQTSGGLTSCTRGVNSKRGLLFNDKFKSYNVTTMPINVIDTPGFDDTNECQKEENHKLIASHIRTPIDVFAYFLNADEDRLDQTIQNHFRLLQEWTYGKIWNNLVIVYNRVNRSNDLQLERAMDFSSIKNRFDEKINNLKHFLWKNMTVENDWKRRIDDSSDKSISMQESDFTNIKYVTLNVDQNRHCNLNKNGFIDAKSKNTRCWSMPNLSETNDYIIDEEYNIDFADDNWVLVDDIRIFQNIINNFKNHPVLTKTMFLSQEIKKDNDEYNKRHLKPAEEVAEAEKIFERNGLDESKCKSVYESAIDGISDADCPQWTDWKSGDCSKKCGIGEKIKNRECWKQGNKTENIDCENEYLGEKAEKKEVCILKQFCEWNHWENWSKCSRTCDGEAFRTRTCSQEPCQGSSKESKLCNPRTSQNETDSREIVESNCPQWSKWKTSECSKKCGVGEKIKTRECFKKGKITANEDCENEYPGEYSEMKDVCILKQFCEWNNWGDWSKCSRTCDGETFRKRTCSQNPCQGSSRESRLCNPRTSKNGTDSRGDLDSDCPQWTKWKPGHCSKKCGAGEITRVRECYKRGVKTNNEDCENEYPGEYSEQTEFCIIEQFCEWDSWGTWTHCSKPCGLGESFQYRNCSSDPCQGVSERKRNCNEHTCLSQWGEWMDHGCGSQCGPGKRHFFRRCQGEFCGNGTEDVTFRQEDCENEPCPEPKIIYKSNDDRKTDSGGGIFGTVLTALGGALAGGLIG